MVAFEKRFEVGQYSQTNEFALTSPEGWVVEVKALSLQVQRPSHVKNSSRSSKTPPELSVSLPPTGNLATSRARVTAASRSLPPQLGSGRSKVSLSARCAARCERQRLFYLWLTGTALQKKKKKTTSRKRERWSEASLIDRPVMFAVFCSWWCSIAIWHRVSAT